MPVFYGRFITWDEGGVMSKYEISVHTDYILVNFMSKVSYMDIIPAAIDMFKMDELQQMNILWVINDSRFILPFHLFNYLTTMIKSYYMQHVYVNHRFAIVVSSHLQGASFELFKNSLADTACRIKVFTDQDAAKQWIKSQ